MSRVSRILVLVGGLCGLVGLGALTFPLALASASAPRSVRIGSAPRSPAGSKVVGSLPDRTRMDVTVTLNPRDPAALAAYATAVATPGSSVFHRYLTVAQFVARFGPTRAQVRAVKSALRARGLRPGAVSANELAIPVQATAGELARAFSTSFHRVSLRGGRIAVANTSAPSITAGVAGYVQSVIGLNSLATPHPLGLTARRHVTAHASPHVVTGGPQPCTAAKTGGAGEGAYTADQLASAYRFSSLYMAGDEGAGQTVALYELEPNSTSDIAAYQTCYGTSASVSYVEVDGGAGSTGAGSGEAALDIEDVIGLAPKANIIVYQGPNAGSDSPGSGPYDVDNAIISQDKAKVISSSWGDCESDEGSTDAAGENTLFQEAATQGQSNFAAAGDSGSEDCGTNALAVDDPGSQPYVTSVGGTTLSALGPPPTQAVWNDGRGAGAGGGGISTLWKMPTYQSGAPAALNVINANSSRTPCGAATGSYCREVPDVSADADEDTGYTIYYKGGWGGIGGTSAAAPLWGAFAALVNASAGCKGVPIGFANPVLYAAGASAYSSDFSDITSGNNDNTGTNSGKFPAGTAYDMASGLGSMIGSTLPATLCSGASIKSIGTVAMPDSGSLPTGVTVDTTNDIAYIAESKANAVAEITKATGPSFSGTATHVASGALPGLNFPDDLALNASKQLFASNFCVGTQAGVCSGEPSGTTTGVSEQTGASSGQQDALGTCKYASGDAVFTPATGGARLFVSCAGSGFVAECTPTSGGSPLCGSASATVTLGKPGGGVTPVPSGMAAIPTETATPAVIVADAANSTLSVVSYSGTTLSTSTPVALATGCEPANVAIGPSVSATAVVYVACPGIGKIETGMVSGTTLGSFTAVSLPTTGGKTPAPYGIAVNQFGSALVVTDSANNDAVVYPFLSGATLGTDAIVAVGTTPDGVGMDENNAFVANESSNNVTVIDPPESGNDRGHYVLARARVAARGPVSLTPLVAPLPAGTSG